MGLKLDRYGINELLSDFPREEFMARCENARALMDQHNIDGMLLWKSKNITYFSGYRPINYFYYMLLPKDDAPVLVVPLTQRGNAETMSWIEDIRYYGPSSLGLADPKETGLKILKELGFADKVIGIEESPQAKEKNVWDALNGHLNQTKKVDTLIWKLRMVKSPLELRYVRKACDIVSKAFLKALGAIQEGMTEREYARIAYKAMLDEGAEDTPLYGGLNLRGGGFRYMMSDTRPTDYKLRRGDMVILDGGITYKGYWCDITRLTCIGPPSKRQKELFDACLEAELAGLEAMQPGAKISEVCKVVEQVLEKRGLTKNIFPGQQIGHGVGLEIHEPPFIKIHKDSSIIANDDIVIEPGMVLAIEPLIYDDPVLKSVIEGYTPGGEGVFFVEDNVLVTEKGPENLTPIPRELNIV